MSVDYSCSGGVGFALTSEIMSKCGLFSDSEVLDRYDIDRDGYLSELLTYSNMEHKEYGNAYSGYVEYMIVMKCNGTLVDAWDRSEVFLDEFNKLFESNFEKHHIQILCENHTF